MQETAIKVHQSGDTNQIWQFPSDIQTRASPYSFRTPPKIKVPHITRELSGARLYYENLSRRPQGGSSAGLYYNQPSYDLCDNNLAARS